MSSRKLTTEERLLILENNDDRHFEHIKSINKQMQDINGSLRSIVELLGGSELNNKQGISSMIKEIKEDLDETMKSVAKHSHKIDNGYWWGRAVALAVIGLVINLFKKA